MKTVAQRAKLMKRLTRDLTAWFKSTGPNLEQEVTPDIRKWLEDDHPRAALVCAKLLSLLGTHKAQFGSKAIMEGDHRGWALLDHGFRYDWWYLRIGGSILMYEWTFSLAHAVSIDEDRMASWLLAAMVKAFDLWRREKKPQGGFTDGWILGWEDSHLAVFLLHLNAMRTNSPVPDLPGAVGLGPYRRVLDSWDSGGPDLAAALENACDYHLDHATGSEDAVKEIGSYPYELFPAEILAIIRVRERLGLPTPEISHPLMQTPLAKPPPPDKRPVLPPDPLLDAVIAKARAQGFLPPEGGDDFAV